MRLAVYDGAGTTYHVALAGGAVLRARDGGGTPARVGDAVWLAISPDAVWPVPA